VLRGKQSNRKERKKGKRRRLALCGKQSNRRGRKKGKRRRYMGIVESQFKIRINSCLTFECAALL
jgi:hypothetical protein